MKQEFRPPVIRMLPSFRPIATEYDCRHRLEGTYTERSAKNLKTYIFSTPQISCKIILQDQVGVVRISEEIALGDRLKILVKELECVFVRELDHGVLERPDLFEHLVCDLRVEVYSAVLELVEGGVELLVYV